jgi:tetratricopeptide (TPR) repeat protein
MIIQTRIIIPTILLLAVISVSIAAAVPSGEAAGLIEQGDALIRTKNYTEALVAYEMALTLDTANFDAWNGKADALNRAGNFTEALAASDTAVALEPSDTRGWINRGYILYNLGQYDDELKAYETAISLEPDNAEAWCNKGYALAGQKRYDDAIAAFDTVSVLQPDYPNLAANRRIAEQLRDAATPMYIRYAPALAGFLVLLVAAGGYIVYRYKTRITSDDTEINNRQSRRRRDRQH